MSFTELLEKVVTLTSAERKELIAAIQEAERQDDQNAEQTENQNGDKPFQTIFDIAPHLVGSIKSGLPADLSTNKEYLKDLGHD